MTLSLTLRRRLKSSMAGYTNEEYADMHLMYGRAQGNTHEARRLYGEWFPGRRLPDPRTFQAVDRRLRESGRFAPVTHAGRPQGRNGNIEEQVLQQVADDPRTSTRRIGAALGIPHMMAWRILHEQQLHPFHLQKVQALNPADYPIRFQFCQWLLQRCTDDPLFAGRILFTDEACFSQDGIINSHNMHIWAEENPHAMVVRAHQQRFSINIWCGILGDTLVGPHILPPRLNGQDYRHFLEYILPTLLEDVPLATRRNMWFLHDGAPAHFSLEARDQLDAAYPLRWIGRGGPVAWPPRSPDLNPLDYFLWGHLKSLVYEQEVPNRPELHQRITDGCVAIQTTDGVFERVRHSLTRRLQTCIDVQGRHFEQLL
jgi:hypothetical protein